jgi:predicted dehydrogenase
MKVSVVGAGDVVAHRLVPALLRSSLGVSPDRIDVYTLDNGDSLLSDLSAQGVATHVIRGDTPRTALVEALLDAGRPTFVSTPPDTHYPYYRALAAHSIRCAVEKPLSTVAEEIADYGAEIRAGAPNLFALSYYAIEKALPLTYLLFPVGDLDPFLEWVEADARTTPAAVERAADEMAKLGRLRALRIDLLEGADRSPRGAQRRWTEVGAGLAYETLIHPLILARNLLVAAGATLAGFAPRVTVGSSSIARIEGTVTYARLDGAHHDVAITLTCGKYLHPMVQGRRGIATYTSGQIELDFDAMEARLTTASGRGPALRVRPQFRGKYAIQTELALAFFRDGWRARPHDQREAQMDALHWLLHNALPARPSFTYVDGSELRARRIIEAG